LVDERIGILDDTFEVMTSRHAHRVTGNSSKAPGNVVHRAVTATTWHSGLAMPSDCADRPPTRTRRSPGVSRCCESGPSGADIGGSRAGGVLLSFTAVTSSSLLQLEDVDHAAERVAVDGCRYGRRRSVGGPDRTAYLDLA
jgi:hypothetical protein